MSNTQRRNTDEQHVALPAIRAVFADMDGTLFDSSHSITSRTVKVMDQLKERGVPVIVATGRPFPDVFPNLAKFNLDPAFVVTSNGARVHDRYHQEIFACDMDAESVCRLFQLPPYLTDEGMVDLSLPARPIAFNVNCRHRWFTNVCLPEVRAAFHPSFLYEQVDPLAKTPESLKGTHSMWIRGHHSDLACVKKFVDRELWDTIECSFALPYILDCFRKGVNKGFAMEKICELLDITASEVVAFGDGMNDLPMLKVAGRGFVMANAAEMVKEAVPNLPVILSNNEDGVAAKLEELLACGAFEDVRYRP